VLLLLLVIPSPSHPGFDPGVLRVYEKEVKALLALLWETISQGLMTSRWR